MEITINQQLYYSNKDLVPIKDVAESLLALESIIRQSPEVLEALFPGTTINSVQVYINELKSDSIWEDVVIKFIFGSQEKFDEMISGLRDKAGMENIMKNPQLLSSIILVMILTGGAYYLGKDTSAQPEQKAIIEANNNTIINIGAGMLKIEAEEFKAIIEGAIKDKNKLAKNAAKIVAPAKKDSSASITFNDNTELRIEPNTVKAMPLHIQEPEEEEFIDDYEALEIEVRATDLDSTKRGWAAVAPQLSKKRIRLQLDPTINPELLAEERNITGKATVIFGHDKEYNKVPKLIFLREIIEEKNANK
jgi:Mor family transcriptional regulator